MKQKKRTHKFRLMTFLFFFLFIVSYCHYTMLYYIYIFLMLVMWLLYKINNVRYILLTWHFISLLLFHINDSFHKNSIKLFIAYDIRTIVTKYFSWLKLQTYNTLQMCLENKNYDIVIYFKCGSPNA